LEEGNQVFEDIRRTLGIGCPPAYVVTATQGEVEDTTARLLASAEDGTFAAWLSQTSMPTDVFVQVDGLNDGWTAAKQVNGGPLEPMTVHDGMGYGTVDLNAGDVELVMGHLVVCSDPRVVVVTWWSPDGLDLYAHNPAAEPISCTFRANPAFEGLPTGERPTDIPPGESIEIAWPV